MRITFTQSGGFVGAVKACTLDTGSLSEDDRIELESLVDASGFIESVQSFSTGGRDRRHYEIVIEKGGLPMRVACDDASLPPAARPLLAFLVARARPAPPASGDRPS